MDASSLLIGMLGGFLLAAAIYHGTEARFERRKPVSRTPASIQRLFGERM